MWEAWKDEAEPSVEGSYSRMGLHSGLYLVSDEVRALVDGVDQLSSQLPEGPLPILVHHSREQHVGRGRGRVLGGTLVTEDGGCCVWVHAKIYTTVDREIFVVNKFLSVPYNDEN